MRDKQGRAYSWWVSRLRHIQYGGTNAVTKVAGWAAAGMAAGIGTRTLYETLMNVDAKYTGNIANQLWEGLKDATPFIHNNDIKTDLTVTLSAGIVGALCYLGGRLIFGQDGAYPSGVDYNRVAVETDVQASAQRAQKRAARKATEADLESRASRSGARVGDEPL